MSVLPDHEIEDLVRYGRLIDPFDETQLQPASYDVRLASTVLIPRSQNKSIDLRERPVSEDYETEITDGLLLWTGRFVLGSTVERVFIPPNIAGRVEGKSTRARQGIQIESAGYLDPGFRGNVTLEIVNLGPDPVLLWPNILIAQLRFEYLSSPCRQPYSRTRNHYQDSKGVVPAGGDRRKVG